MISKQAIANLRNFFGTQFHQDYELESDDPDVVVEGYIAGSRHSRQDLKDMGQALLDYIQGVDDAELDEKLMKDLGCYYYPYDDDLSTREWLSHVAAMFIENDKPG